MQDLPLQQCYNSKKHGRELSIQKKGSNCMNYGTSVKRIVEVHFKNIIEECLMTRNLSGCFWLQVTESFNSINNKVILSSNKVTGFGMVIRLVNTCTEAQQWSNSPDSDNLSFIGRSSQAGSLLLQFYKMAAMVSDIQA